MLRYRTKEKRKIIDLIINIDINKSKQKSLKKKIINSDPEKQLFSIASIEGAYTYKKK